MSTPENAQEQLKSAIRALKAFGAYVSATGDAVHHLAEEMRVALTPELLRIIHEASEEALDAQEGEDEPDERSAD